jgi:hypothetical protein
MLNTWLSRVALQAAAAQAELVQAAAAQVDTGQALLLHFLVQQTTQLQLEQAEL